MAFLYSGLQKSQATKVSEQRAQQRSGVRALARKESKSAKEEQTLITDIKRLVGNSMAKLTWFLQDMNKNMDIKSMHNMFKEFEIQPCRLGETATMMEENMGSVFEAENTSECTDNALSSIFAELGVDIKHQMQASPASTGLASRADNSKLDLEDRLRHLWVPT